MHTQNAKWTTLHDPPTEEVVEACRGERAKQIAQEAKVV